MFNSLPKRTAAQCILDSAVAVLLSVGAGLILGWLMAPFFFLLYLCTGFAMELSQRRKKEVDAYRKEWSARCNKAE